MLFKIGNLNNQFEVCWHNLYQKESYPNFSRLVIGCKSKEIPLILEFCKKMEGPFGVLHVLLASRLGKESGRYQSPYPMTYEELEFFLYEHQEYFEQDGRQNIWVSSISGEGQFIFDNHNYIYAYGNIDSYITDLTNIGFSEGEISIPDPHCHNYHKEFDSKEEDVNKAFDWLYSPLQESDDYSHLTKSSNRPASQPDNLTFAYSNKIMHNHLRQCIHNFGKLPRTLSLWDRLWYYRVSKPSWLRSNSEDKLAIHFENLNSLVCNGIVVWGHVVQANSLMFEEGPDGFVGGMSAAKYIRITETSIPTATRDLNDLVEKNVLTRIGERKSTRYFLALSVSR
jgi:hypothetical protein